MRSSLRTRPRHGRERLHLLRMQAVHRRLPAACRMQEKMQLRLQNEQTRLSRKFNSRIRVITRLFKISPNNRPRFLADMPLSSFVHGPFERDASGGIDLASEQLHHVHL